MKKIKYKNLLIFMIIFWSMVFGWHLDVSATEVITPTVSPGMDFQHHNSFILSYGGGYGFCFQRGYPFRSMVSDLQMTTTVLDIDPSILAWVPGAMSHYGEAINTAEFMRILVKAGGTNAHSGSSGDWQTPYFAGWGQWELNADHTGFVLVSDDNIPSSGLVDVGPDGQPLFEKYTIDTEDGPVTQTTIATLNPYQENAITGHEGAKPTYNIQLTRIDLDKMSVVTGPNSKEAMGPSAINAAALVKYYIYEDPDANSYSTKTKYRTAQALMWAIQYDLINTVGDGGSQLRMTFESNHYGKFDGGTGYLSCDDFIKTYIGHQNAYDSMKLYRQFVWKVTNMRKAPSFGYQFPALASDNPIHLTWDANENAYVATIADANGVLDYFDYNIPGVSVTKNGDGTLKLRSENQIGGTLVSSTAESRLLPPDCRFNLPTAWRWTLEGKTASFTYTAILRDWDTSAGHYIHNSNWGCPWKCLRNPDEAASFCTGTKNADRAPGGYTRHEHDSSCGSASDNYPDCDNEDNAGWEEGDYTTHSHDIGHCSHKYGCPSYNGTSTASVTTEDSLKAYNNNYGICAPTYWNFEGNCTKIHLKLAANPYPQITVKYQDWQDIVALWSSSGTTLVDPIHSYIAVTTDEHNFPCETDVEILLIAENDEWNDLTYPMPNGKVVKHSSHVRVGEKFHLKYIYSYKGASKGFRVSYSETNKPYYNYTYLSRMYVDNSVNIYDIRGGAGFFESNRNVPNASLVQDLTDIKIRGIYTTPEAAYTLKGVYKWDSESQAQKWNDKIYLDALVNDQWDDNYNNKPASSITSSLTTPLLTAFTVSKPSHNDMLVVWEFDTEDEVFSSGMVYATAYIDVGANSNYSHSYFDAAYNYGKESMWNYYFSDQPHKDVGGVGYFTSGQSGESIANHNVYTQNAELPTYAVRNKVWQSDIDIKVSNFVQNTGAGITEHIYQKREQDTHDMNYNLYYTIKVENPKATIFAHKIRMYDNDTHSDMDKNEYNTTADVYEFDVNNMIAWGSTGASQTVASYGNTIVVDHIKTGTTYIQREIPTVLATMINEPAAQMNMKIYPNYDKLVYEDYYSGVNLSTSGLSTTVSVSMKQSYYPLNEVSAESKIYSAMNPKVVAMQPSNITNSNNVPNKSKDEDDRLYHPGTSTQFTIQLSDGTTKTVKDSNTKTYTQYDFEYNPTNRDNRVPFPTYRRSVVFFKYSKTNYVYNSKNDYSALGVFKGESKAQKEAYYISQVLFKSNYTTKYRKELEAKGATYIEEKDNSGQVIGSWIDMVNQNSFAIVAAGQGFEIKVTVKYENSLLTQYLSRYFGTDDAQNDTIGTSNRIQKKYLTSTTETNRQFANISALTLPETKYKDTERAYISDVNTIDQLAVNLITGSNVFNDLYVLMSDNPSVVYSYSGIYDTPVIFERNIKYSEDFSVTSVTYTMKQSESNGVASNLNNMKFFTDQLAPDADTPGIVEGTSTAGEGHSIKLWTPIIAATPFDYPSTMEERYIGDAIELGYTTKTSGPDDSIVHIVQ